MKHSIVTGVLAILCTAGSAAPALAPQGQRPCERSNAALRLASRERAEADYWLRVSRVLHDAGGIKFSDLRDAWSDRGAALKLADDVFQARETACAMFGHEVHAPDVAPGNFTTHATNVYLPLEPGRVLVREKQTDEGLERIESSVAEGTVEIGGIECLVIQERETIDGVLVEYTDNWVAQHADGSIWYFGELAQAFEGGILDSLDGSWRYGSQGAMPGVLMPATPLLGAAYRQEFRLGVAEDVAQVVRLDETVTVPAGTFHHCVVIAEWDPLEPFEYLLTFIAPNVGMVLEIDTRTGERSELVEIRD